MKRSPAASGAAPTDLMDLRAFCQVVDHGSITAAARALGETKGSVSRRLSRLERALGVVLVQRSPRRVQPTDVGAAYRARLGRALELLDDASAQVQQTRDAPSGHLRVTAPTDIGASLVAPLVAGFVERFPDVRVEMLLTEARLDFDAHQIDVAIRAAGSLPDSSLVAHKLADLESRLFAAASYLAAHGTPRAPEELAAHRMVLAPAGATGTQSLTLRHGTDPRRSATVDVRAAVASGNYFANKEAAIAGAGVALLPTMIARPDVEARRLVPVLKDYVGFTGALHLIHHGTRFLQPKVRAFRDYVLAALGVPARR